MKTDIKKAQLFAEQIAVLFYEHGYGGEGQLSGMVELARTRGADMIEARSRMAMLVGNLNGERWTPLIRPVKRAGSNPAAPIYFLV